MKKILISILFIFTSVAGIFAQSNTFYFNDCIFQSNQLNPARQSSCKFSLGLPVLSTVYLNLKDQGLSYADFFTPIPNQPDSFYIDLNNIYNKMPNMSYISNNNKISLGYLAFWINDYFINLSSSVNTNFVFGYPKSLLNIKNGNYFTDNRYVSLNGLSTHFDANIEFDLGVSKEIIPNLTIGAKLKYFKGLGYLDVKAGFDWKVSTADSSIYDYNFENINYSINYAGPLHVNFPDLASQNFNTNNLYNIPDFSNLSNVSDYIKYGLTAFNANGFGVDLGAIYKLQNKFEFSVSVLDLGFISWKNNPLSVSKTNGTFTFSGLDIAKYLDTMSVFTMMSNSSIILDSIKNDFVDSLLKATLPTVDTLSFTTALNTTIILGASYSPLSWLKMGAMYRGYFYNKHIISSYNLSGTIEFWRGWSVMMSYTAFNKSYNNIGLGFSAKLLPFQFYLLMENVAPLDLGVRYLTVKQKTPDLGLATKWVKNMNMFSIQFGFNFMLGCRKNTDYGLID